MALYLVLGQVGIFSSQIPLYCSWPLPMGQIAPWPLSTWRTARASHRDTKLQGWVLHHWEVENVHKNHFLLPSPSVMVFSSHCFFSSLSLLLPSRLLFWIRRYLAVSGLATSYLFRCLTGSHLASGFLCHPLLCPRSPQRDQPHQQKENEVSSEIDPLNCILKRFASLVHFGRLRSQRLA